MTVVDRPAPLCWGHRGASADFPENTLASFESAARAGSDGIESDVWMTSDDVVLMFHDPELGRTTRGGSGKITEQPYKDNIEHLMTSKTPEQKIPTFDQTLAWLVRPENSHMTLNIDVKAGNDPKRLFTLMRSAMSNYSSWETNLAPRLILGLWHPKFIGPSLEIIPELKRCFIGIHLDIAQLPEFWTACDAFSIAFPILMSAEGTKFRARCREEGKELYTWTLNAQEQWVTAAQWGLDVVMTDTPDAYMDFRRIYKASSIPITPLDPWFAWKSWIYWSPVVYIALLAVRRRLEVAGGPLAPWFTARAT